MPIAVLGAGPTGLQVVAGLIESGVEASEIVLIDRFVPARQTFDQGVGHSAQMSLQEVFIALGGAGHNSSEKVFAKQRIDVFDPRGLPFSPAYVWGASCLPPHSAYLHRFEFDGFLEAIDQVKLDWSIHAEIDSLINVFSLTTETLGGLPRKPMATQLVSASDGHVGHSRLAMGWGSEKCLGLGRCFQGCPSSINWTPRRHLDELVTANPDLQFLSSEVSRLRESQDGISVSLNESEVVVDQLVVATGWHETRRLLHQMDPHKWPTRPNMEDMQQSTVCMIPMILPSQDCSAFENAHFAYHDLVMVTDAHNGKPEPVVTQIYLATPELVARIATEMPNALRKLLANLGPGLGNFQAFCRQASRIAIAMTFFPGGTWTADRQNIGSQMKHVAVDLRKHLGAFVPSLSVRFGRVLDSGLSHHVGSWAPAKTLIAEWLASNDTDSPRVIAADATALPTVPAGPHTLSSAAMARLIGRKIAEGRH